MKATTPREITPKIKTLGREIVHGYPFLEYVPVEPLYPPLACFINCDRFLSDHPEAKIVYGWSIWQSAFILEAEFHAVIEIQGEKKCITTPVDGEKRILFLRDSRVPRFTVAMFKDQKRCVLISETWNNFISGEVEPRMTVVPCDGHHGLIERIIQKTTHLNSNGRMLTADEEHDILRAPMPVIAKIQISGGSKK